MEWHTEFDAEYAHAVGVFALRYNALEFAVYSIFQRYAPGRSEAQALLYETLNNKGRRDFISSVAQTEDSIAAADAVLHAMKCFEICSENRNLLMHAAPMHPAEESEKFVMVKRRAKEPHILSVYDFEVSHIREAANAIEAVESYVWDIVMYWKRFAEFSGGDSRDFPELPEKPDLPRKLSLSVRS